MRLPDPTNWALGSPQGIQQNQALGHQKGLVKGAPGFSNSNDPGEASDSQPKKKKKAALKLSALACAPRKSH